MTGHNLVTISHIVLWYENSFRIDCICWTLQYWNPFFEALLRNGLGNFSFTWGKHEGYDYVNKSEQKHWPLSYLLNLIGLV